MINSLTAQLKTYRLYIAIGLILACSLYLYNRFVAPLAEQRQQLTLSITSQRALNQWLSGIAVQTTVIDDARKPIHEAPVLMAALTQLCTEHHILFSLQASQRGHVTLSINKAEWPSYLDLLRTLHQQYRGFTIKTAYISYADNGVISGDISFSF